MHLSAAVILRLSVLLFLFCALRPLTVEAQTSNLWPEAVRLIAPEVGMSGLVSGPPLPVMGWGLAGGTAGISAAASPVYGPLLWLDSDHPVIRFERRGVLIYRDRLGGDRNSDLSGSGSGVSASVPLQPGSVSILFGYSGEAATTVVDLADRTGNLRRQPLNRDAWLGIRGGTGKWRCMVSGGRLGITEGPLLFTAAIERRLGEEWSVAVWAAKGAGNDEFDVYYEDATAVVTAPSERYSLGMRVSGRVLDWKGVLRVQGSNRSGRGRSEPLHRLRPRPRPRLAELRLESPGGTWQAAAGLESSRHRADLDSRGLRYGRLYLEDERRWIRVGRSIPLFGLDHRVWAGYARTALDGEGEFEFWPFTPTIVDLLGLERRAVADAGIEVLSTGSRISYALSSGGGLEFGLDLHHLLSDGTLESWEPYLLGFGKRNIIVDRLAVKSAQLADLGLEAAVPLAGGIRVTCGVAQVVPIAVQERVLEPGAPPGEQGARGPETVWGGFRWWFSVDLSAEFFGGYGDREPGRFNPLRGSARPRR